MTTEPPISIKQVVQPPPPRIVTDETAKRWTGHGVRAWRKLARAMAAAGYPVMETTAGYAAVLDDVVTFIRSAPPLQVRERGAANDGGAEYKRVVGG